MKKKKRRAASRPATPPRRSRPWESPDPRSPQKILEEEALLTKRMLAKIFGYKSVRSVERIIEDDCVSGAPCLKPIYIHTPHRRRGRSGVLFPQDFPSFQSLRFRREDVVAYLKKHQRAFPVDLEGALGEEGGEQGKQDRDKTVHR